MAVGAGIVIGAIDRLEWPALRPWVLSLNGSGFGGRVVLLAYRASAASVDALERHGVEVRRVVTDPLGRPLRYPGDARLMELPSLRFFHIWAFLSSEIAGGGAGAGDWALAIDVRDVVFQRDPGEWLRAHPAGDVIVAQSEGLRFRDEPWSRENMRSGFGDAVLDGVADRVIFNAGVVAAPAALLADVSLLTHLISSGHGQETDQSALNLLLHTALRDRVRAVRADEDWACIAGTLADPRNRSSVGHALVDPAPELADGRVRTAGGQEYCIVHQYDRVPEWKAALDGRFG